MLLNVLDYADAAAAIAAAMDGDRIYFPGGRVYEAPAEGWVITKSLELFGDGPGNPTNYNGTVLTPSAQQGTNDVIVLQSSAAAALAFVSIHDLRITRRSGISTTDGRHGIRFIGAAPMKHLSEITLRNLWIDHLGGAGVWLEGYNAGDGSVNNVFIEDCTVQWCDDVGICLTRAFGAFLSGLCLSDNGKEGCAAFLSEPALYGCSFVSNRRNPTPHHFGEPTGDLALVKTSPVRIDFCRFDGFATQGASSRACVLRQSLGAYISGCDFTLDDDNVTATGILITDDGAGKENFSSAPLIMPNRFAHVAKMIEIANTTAGAVILPQYSTPSAGSITAPAEALLSAASIARPGANDLQGLVVPSLPGTPSAGEQVGMLAYVPSQTPPLRIRTNAGWRGIQYDSTPPSQITDLHVTATGSSTITIAWTAPDDPPYTGPVAAYDIRYSLAPITEATFPLASPGPTVVPSAPNTQESALITGLSPLTTYHMAIRSKDQSGNWSPISNVPSGTTS